MNPAVLSPPKTAEAYLTFGMPARLKPIPIKPVEQQLRSYETVRDTAIDWLDDQLGLLRAVSARGHIHRYLAEVRQDNFAFIRRSNYLAVAVSDGVGNAKASHLGSAFASRAIVENDALLREVVAAGSAGEVSLRDIATLLRSVATDKGVDAAEVSTTLTVAVVLDTSPSTGETSVVLAQIGDSPAFKLSHGEWIELVCPALKARRGDLIDNSVEPLPGHHTASVWVETFQPGESLMLVSDGVGDPVKSNGAYAIALGELWRHAAPSPADLLKVLDATVKSFDDDRTLVGIRFENPQS
ncbi:protein phosphatase 2C domain-containing protein [Rhodococcus sp. NPDC060086]|uniref:protein phosphatase 2C domain-containing protein n=1 Tax=Rhodococcus sp. NPDC060086 TaxID=3347055 RepID=UPI00365688AB